MRRSISIIVPAFNEESRLPNTLAKVRAYLDHSRWEFSEIIVVNDGSRDGTAEAARAGGACLLDNPGNRGKGFSVARGMFEAKGEWALFTDADLSTPISELEKLWAAAERESSVIAIGSRAVDRSLVGVHQPPLRELIGRMFNVVMRIVNGLPYRDTQCGFKLFKTEVARQIFSLQRLYGFGFDVEALFIAHRFGYCALEIPVIWNNVPGTTVSAWRGLLGFVELLSVRWNGLTGKYK